jgi:uncharacterized C2H2 Zn-finger protein
MIECLNCGRTFESFEAYQRHDWHAHAGELNKGEVYR